MTADITTWQGRLIVERDELSDKLFKLNSFLARETIPIPVNDFALLTVQAYLMQAYLDVLDRRLVRAKA